jgi:hypothetical protein
VTEAVIEIPMVPPVECKPNWRGHWRKKAAAVRMLREAAKLATVDVLNAPGSVLSAFCGYYGLVVMDLEIAWNGRRSGMDDDNAKASCKAIIDGISDALWESRDAHVHIGRVDQIRGTGEVRVTVRREG